MRFVLHIKWYFVTKNVLTYLKGPEQFLVTECFFNLFLEVSQIYKIKTIIIQIGKKLWGFRNLQEKLEKVYFQTRLDVHNFDD